MSTSNSSNGKRGEAQGRATKNAQKKPSEPEKRRRWLSPAEKKDVLRRLAKGEKQVSIAKSYGVTRAAISLIKQKNLYPERYAENRRRGPYKMKLLPAEAQKFAEELRGKSPHDHGIASWAREQGVWTIDQARELGRKLFNKSVSVRVIKLSLPSKRKRRDIFNLPPEPPGPPDVTSLPPELANDKSYVKWYLSKAGQRVLQREYELALADYQRRVAEGKIRPLEEDGEGAPKNSPRKRAATAKTAGKYAKGRSSPVAKSTKKRKGGGR